MRAIRVITGAACAVAALALTPGTSVAGEAVDIEIPGVYVSEYLRPPEPDEEVEQKCTTKMRRDTATFASEESHICVVESEGERWAYVDYGSVYWSQHEDFDNWIDATVYLKQCRPSDGVCSTIAANHQFYFTDAAGYAVIRTSAKPNSFGHVYQACASLEAGTGYRFVNVCSPLMA